MTQDEEETKIGMPCDVPNDSNDTTAETILGPKSAAALADKQLAVGMVLRSITQFNGETSHTERAASTLSSIGGCFW